jgi:hypothetical protein
MTLSQEGSSRPLRNECQKFETNIVELTLRDLNTIPDEFSLIVFLIVKHNK